MLSGRRCRLELTAEQAGQCEECASVCRAVWNTALEQWREHQRRGAWMNYVPQAAELADAKREHPWLKTAGSGYEKAEAELCRVEGDEVAVALGPPA
ncbi:helix-turn-helix domain-containing protein [Streptomyces sp. NPDC001514]